MCHLLWTLRCHPDRLLAACLQAEAGRTAEQLERRLRDVQVQLSHQLSGCNPRLQVTTENYASEVNALLVQYATKGYL